MQGVEMNKKPDPAEGLNGKQTRKARPAYGSPEWRSIWLRCVDAARSEWSKVPYNDLAQTGGDPQKLVALLLRHYELTERDARRQVEAFLMQCGS
jgi:hypothetical protein